MKKEFPQQSQVQKVLVDVTPELAHPENCPVEQDCSGPLEK